MAITNQKIFNRTLIVNKCQLKLKMLLLSLTFFVISVSSDFSFFLMPIKKKEVLLKAKSVVDVTAPNDETKMYFSRHVGNPAHILLF